MAGKSMKVGGGGRFAAMVASGKSPALAAYIGRKKYGKGKFQKMAKVGKNRVHHSFVQMPDNSYSSRFNGMAHE
jgi:hypothetical protein